MEKREHFGSFGALMAMAGSAVGLGNLWRFPYLLGENGGAAFLILYILSAFVVALPVFFCEFMLGRRSGTNSFIAFNKLAPGSRWRHLGIINVVTPIIILSFYSVIGGWCVAYLIKACRFGFSASMSQAELSEMFSSFSSSLVEPSVCLFLFLGATALIVILGVTKGIEMFGKIMMPILFFLVVAMGIYVSFLPGAADGYRYLFSPEFSKITAKTVCDAMGQAFFSMSLGCGCIMTYASYVRKEDDIISHCVGTTVLDMVFALIAGCAIMPAVFAFSLNPGSGPSLVFETLPFIFARMPGGTVLAILFFVALLVAALTSSISMCEVTVAFFSEQKNISRRKATLIMSIILLFAGLFFSLTLTPYLPVKIFGKTPLDVCDTISANYLMTLGSLGIVLFAGWKMKRSELYDEFISSGLHTENGRYFRILYFLIRYVAPVAVLAIFLTGILLK